MTTISFAKDKSKKYLRKRTLAYIVSQIENGCFKPLMPGEDIGAFTAASINGIERDRISAQNCRLKTHPIFLVKNIDPQRLINLLCRNQIYLLGGNSDTEI